MNIGLKIVFLYQLQATCFIQTLAMSLINLSNSGEYKTPKSYMMVFLLAGCVRKGRQFLKHNADLFILIRSECCTYWQGHCQDASGHRTAPGIIKTVRMTIFVEPLLSMGHRTKRFAANIPFNPHTFPCKRCFV